MFFHFRGVYIFIIPFFPKIRWVSTNLLARLPSQKNECDYVVIPPDCLDFHANGHDEKYVSENKLTPLHVHRKDEKKFIFAI